MASAAYLWLLPGRKSTLPSASNQLSFDGAVGLDSVGPLVAVILICLGVSHIQTYEQAHKLFWIVMPITAVIFLVTPSLEEVTLPYWNLLVSNLQNGGSVCMLLCTWALLLLSARTNGFSTDVVFGASLALTAFLSILGALTFSFLGQGGNVITVVMFILYMGAVILFLALGNTEDRTSTNPAREFFKSFIQSRCDKLSETHGLTPRETELLALLGRGHGYAYIAESLYISEATVRTHARNIYHKLGVSSQEELLGIIDHLDSPEIH
ncbi:response regulator transcription factor [Adlercreutzia shanghongiae]|uniref:response regulator transcription factor n=1 Tax=Adlercreutzia shanghongiae TaxID=3111773 RepID=UPI002DBBEF18|nr:helix-turn-helix transcriptional regulator [Adlercreutzia sp. R25]